MKHVNVKQAIGGILVILGVVAIVMGTRSNESGRLDKIKKHVMNDHSHARKKTTYLVSGIALIVVGAGMVFYCRKKR